MRGRVLIPRLLAVGALVATAYLYQTRSPAAGTRLPDGALLDAFRARRSGVEVEATGVVARRLPDDLEGSRHQRFILRVGDQAVLVAHNIDLAPRVPVSEGDTVQLRGEYEWNQLGGVIHWTHRDPAGRHQPGWIRVRGDVYR
jgi:uncharacterized protein DUF3465